MVPKESMLERNEFQAVRKVLIWVVSQNQGYLFWVPKIRNTVYCGSRSWETAICLWIGSSCNFALAASSRLADFRWTPLPVIVTIRDNKDYIRVLLYSYYTTITGWGVFLRQIH